jgi:hypothetical protein
MKLLPIALLTALSINASAQLTLEHTYSNAATWNFCNGNASQLMILELEQSGERIINVNRCDGQIELYDINHNPVSTIDLSGLPMNPGNYLGDILYISENLFDTDPELEFMYIVQDSNYYLTKIYNHDGTELFSENGVAWIKPNFHQQQYPIYNTSEGTKMILSYQNGDAKVFGLAGTLSSGVYKQNQEQLDELNALSGAYPNPTNNSFRINYNLPLGTTRADIILYDIQGKEINRYPAKGTNGTIEIPTSGLAQGSYYYQLQSPNLKTGGRNITVVH